MFLHTKMQENGKLIMEEPEADNAYVLETSMPLRTLYALLLDLYDNAYPIPFIAFRKLFDRYMKATRNNILDTIVLLLYGAKDITHIGTGEESITVDRIKGDKKYNEDVKTVKSPFYRFIMNDDEVRVGYDYAVVIDYDDHACDDYDDHACDDYKEQNNTHDYAVHDDHKTENIDEVIESDEKVASKVLPRFPILIDPVDAVLSFDFPEGRHNTIDMKNMRFITTLNGDKRDVSTAMEIDLQPVPEGCVGVKSYLLEAERTYVTELDNGNQFCYDTRYGRFDMINDDGIVVRNYVISA